MPLRVAAASWVRAVVVFGEPLDLSHRWEQSFDKAVAQGIVDEVMEAIAGLKRDLEEQEAREGQAGTPAEAPVQEQPTA